MTNVVQFKRKVVVEAPKTKWDEVYNQCGEFPEYKLVALMLAMSWCYQTGQGQIGDRLLAAARASGSSPAEGSFTSPTAASSNRRCPPTSRASPSPRSTATTTAASCC